MLHAKSFFRNSNKLLRVKPFLMTVRLHEFGKILLQIQDSKQSGYYYGQKTRAKYVERFAGEVGDALFLDLDIWAHSSVYIALVLVLSRVAIRRKFDSGCNMQGREECVHTVHIQHSRWVLGATM
jgi:hypothetical protein